MLDVSDCLRSRDEDDETKICRGNLKNKLSSFVINLVVLTNQTKRFGHEINEQETKYMRLFRKPYNGGANINCIVFDGVVILPNALRPF